MAMKAMTTVTLMATTMLLAVADSVTPTVRRLVTATMANGNVSRIIIWNTDTIILKKNLDGQTLYYVADAATGLRAVIAIHSTALGPSLGGIRFWHYPSEADAVTDA